MVSCVRKSTPFASRVEPCLWIHSFFLPAVMLRMFRAVLNWRLSNIFQTNMIVRRSFQWNNGKRCCRTTGQTKYITCKIHRNGKVSKLIKQKPGNWRANNNSKSTFKEFHSKCWGQIFQPKQIHQQAGGKYIPRCAENPVSSGKDIERQGGFWKTRS